jgi:hypothetical protein
MVDDVAAVVIMLSPPPKQAVPSPGCPSPMFRAFASNADANSPEAKASRDALAALPYQNFFRHLDLVSSSV